MTQDMNNRPSSTPFGFTIPAGMAASPVSLGRNGPINAAEIRQAWMKSFTNEKIGKRLSVRQLPICCLRSQLNDRKQKCKSAEPYYWMSEEDKRKLAERKRCFDRQWSAEITKRHKTTRPVYTVQCRPTTPPMKKYITAKYVRTDSFFRKADSHRPLTHEERVKSSHHFVSPEWTSEVVSWKRFNKTSLDIHRYSLF